MVLATVLLAAGVLIRARAAFTYRPWTLPLLVTGALISTVLCALPTALSPLRTLPDVSAAATEQAAG